MLGGCEAYRSWAEILLELFELPMVVATGFCTRCWYSSSCVVCRCFTTVETSAGAWTPRWRMRRHVRPEHVDSGRTLLHAEADFDPIIPPKFENCHQLLHNFQVGIGHFTLLNIIDDEAARRSGNRFACRNPEIPQRRSGTRRGQPLERHTKIELKSQA